MMNQMKGGIMDTSLPARAVTGQRRAVAVIEVVLVFGLTLFLMAVVILSPAGEWELQTIGYPFLEYFVMMAVPWLWMLVTRKSLVAHGLSVRNLRDQLAIVAIAFVPVFLASLPFLFVDYKSASGAFILAGIEIALLLILGWLLLRRPTMSASSILAGAALLVAAANGAGQSPVVKAISAFVFYIFFLGLGEELLFRGYIQSRLNSAWGRPFLFFGASWGWGLVIMSLLFGVMHWINLSSLASGSWQLEPWWGFWTAFGGLVFGFLREKTGSIVAPAILHGLPEALAGIGRALMGA
jgi:membrane protease YdiL (CAAX protease family)